MTVEKQNGNGRLEEIVQVGTGERALYDPATGEVIDLAKAPAEAPAKQAGEGQNAKKDRKKGRAGPPKINLEAQAKNQKPLGMPRPYDPDFEERCPNCFELLTMGVYSDGTERILSGVVIGRQPGCYTITLQDHEMMRQCKASAASVAGLWDALEAATNNPLCWTTYKSRVNRKGEPFSLAKKKGGQAKG